MLERQVFLFSFLFWNIGWTERPVKPTSENAICRNTYTSHFQRRRFLNPRVFTQGLRIPSSAYTTYYSVAKNRDGLQFTLPRWT